jgi:Flp pilus assembly protein TadD
LELNPNLAPAHLNLGLALQGMGGTSAKEAEASFRRAAELDPGLADAHHALGQIHQARGEDDAAMECYRLAVAARPDLIEAKCNLGNILRERLDLDAAMAQYDAALATAPGVAALHANRGVALHELGRFEEALAAYDAALAIEPDDAECRRNRGMTRLLLGRFEAGWADYEARWQTRRFKDEGRGRDPRKPRWAVDAVKDGTTVLVQAEQGIGDTIQFARYIPRIAALGFHVTLQCPGPLMRLLASLEGVTKIVEQGGPAPDHDFHIPMLSLPAAFSTRLESVPADIPYLKPEKDETAAWRDELSDVAGPRIGIAWKGSAAHPRDRVRSPGLAPLLPLLALPGASFLSLQKDGGAADLAAHGLDAVIDPTVALRDFAATAALVANLDLVVTCDTAVGHLAGALGRPVVMLLPHVPEWRWLLERGDTPWYPTMRLIRQPAPGDWAGAVRSAADHIRRHWL